MKDCFIFSVFCATLLAVFTPSCGTNAGKTAATIVDSPTTQLVLDAAIKAAETKLGEKLSPEANTLLSGALEPLVNAGETSLLSGIAGALAGKQATPAAADSGQLVAAQTSKGVPVATAVPIAESVPTIVNTSSGVTPAKANAAVVAAVKTIAAK